MKFELTIDCDNAAFEDDATPEVVRILMAVIKKLESGQRDQIPIHDYNGNRVGSAGFIDD